MRRKTVFILGAGFSFDAGIPMQGELLSTILQYDLTRYEDLKRCRNRIKRFVREVFGLNDVQIRSLALEDIYTPLHQAVSRNEYLK